MRTVAFRCAGMRLAGDEGGSSRRPRAEFKAYIDGPCTQCIGLFKGDI